MPRNLSSAFFAASLLACSDSSSPLGEVDTGLLCSSAAECSASPCAQDSPDVERPLGWGEASHCAGAAPDYERLFNDDAPVVHRFDILIEPDVYQQTLDDLESLLGAQNCGGGFRPPGPGTGSDQNPVWVPVTVKFDGLTWWKVGMRYKGNSSLRSAWQSCIQKLSFRLDFDQFEGLYPELQDQRFYGFKKMTFSNGFKDASLMRDKLAAEVFRRAGIPAARGAFARVYVSVGDDAPLYYGLYTMIEDPSNRMLDSQFGDDSGNLYKPESRNGVAATWAADVSAAEIEQDFDKKTNEGVADWSDVFAAIVALHAGNRLTDAPAWRAELEGHLDVDGFLGWFATNQAMVNWDSYGCMAQNYYLYADPSDPTDRAPGGRFVWFPWDLNEALLAENRCNLGDAEGLIPDSSVLGEQWPLIRYLLDDAAYLASYEAKLGESIADGGPFDEAWVKARVDTYLELIGEYVVGPTEHEAGDYTFLQSDAELNDASTALQRHAETRAALVRSVLGL